MPLRPLANDVAIIPLEDPEMIGSLYVPEEAKQRCDQGVVKYKGKDVKDLKIGDHVLFSGYAGTKVTVAGEGELIVMDEEAVAAVMDEEPLAILPVSAVYDIINEVLGELYRKELITQDDTARLREEIFTRIDTKINMGEFEF